MYLRLGILLGLVVYCSSGFTSEELARQKNCIACHAVDKKLVGPAFNAISERYRGVPGAESKLVTTVLRGGSGNWGAIPQPPYPNLAEGDARTLVRWILFPAKELPSASVKPAPSVAPSENPSLNHAKLKCSELGFRPDTEKFGECVLRLSK